MSLGDRNFSAALSSYSSLVIDLTGPQLYVVRVARNVTMPCVGCTTVFASVSTKAWGVWEMLPQVSTHYKMVERGAGADPL